MKLLIEVVIEPDGEDRFHAYSPACRGVHIDGSTEAETLARMKDALRLYLDSMVRHDEPLPLGPHCVDADDDAGVYRVPPGARLRPVELELS